MAKYIGSQQKQHVTTLNYLIAMAITIWYPTFYFWYSVACIFSLGKKTQIKTLVCTVINVEKQMMCYKFSVFSGDITLPHFTSLLMLFRFQKQKVKFTPVSTSSTLPATAVIKLSFFSDYNPCRTVIMITWINLCHSWLHPLPWVPPPP